MAENQILPFAYADGANVLSQSDYQSDNQRLIGHQPGIARSALENKALRQASTMAAGLAQWIADNQDDAITDAMTPAEIAAALEQANLNASDRIIDAQAQWFKLKNNHIVMFGLTGITMGGNTPTFQLTVQLPVAITTNRAFVFSCGASPVPLWTQFENLTPSGWRILFGSLDGQVIPAAPVSFSWIAWGIA